MRRYVLSQNDLKIIENKLYLYKRIDNAIAVRKQELEVKENHDENTGGGRSSKISKPVEELVMKWQADPQIQNFNNFRKLVDDMLLELDDVNRLIFHYRWVDSNRYTWEEIADKCELKERQVYRKRRAILELYDEKSGGFW
jgi:RinA family phage transcriptional activator